MSAALDHQHTFVVEIVSPSSSGRRIDRLLNPPYSAELDPGALVRPRR